jgi:VWFA-related protein
MLRTIFALLAASLLAEQPRPEATLRITVNLIQVDAVVTDGHGRHVPDLQKEDFEILQDGKPRQVEYLSYLTTSTAPAPAPPARTPHPAVGSFPGAARAVDTRRAIALVVDDLNLSFTSVHSVREALRKFVDEQMQPGDLVAILRTGGGIGSLEQFSMNKRLLHAAIDRVRWNVAGRGGIDSMPALQDDAAAAASDSNNAEALRHRLLSIGTAGALRHVVEGLRQLPGRKSVLLFSDGIRFAPNMAAPGQGRGTLSPLRSLADQANRAAVVFYTIDARGLMYPGLQAKDDVGGDPVAVVQQINARSTNFMAERAGLAYLAQETGGLFYKDDNDLPAAARQALNDQSGYYLLGYRPGEDAFARPRGVSPYHHLKVVVKRPGLHVRTRAGYYGMADREPPPAAQDRAARLLAALRSPFVAGEIGLRLTGLFGNAADTGSYIHAMPHIDGRDLTFGEDGADWKKAEVDLVLVAVGENGAAVERSARHYRIRVSRREFDGAVKQGFLYRLMHTVKKPGAYQLRAAVRDTNSLRMGSASQFIEIPNVSNRRMALSGILLESRSEAATGGPAVRVFRQGSPLAYGLVVYNPRLAGAGVSQVDIQARLFRDGKPVWSAPPVPLASPSLGDPTRVRFMKDLDLGPTMPPGEYLLQVTAIDKRAPRKSTPVVQWTDFELAPAK